jgi:hypothetical protein
MLLSNSAFKFNLRRYIKAWIKRPAWVDCYKTTSLYNSAMMMAAAQTIHKMAGFMHSLRRLVGGSNGDLDWLELIDRRSYVSHCSSASEIRDAENVWARVY